jgi:hypothetical protein
MADLKNGLLERRRDYRKCIMENFRHLRESWTEEHVDRGEDEFLKGRYWRIVS